MYILVQGCLFSASVALTRVSITDGTRNIWMHHWEYHHCALSHSSLVRPSDCFFEHLGRLPSEARARPLVYLFITKSHQDCRLLQLDFPDQPARGTLARDFLYKGFISRFVPVYVFRITAFKEIRDPDFRLRHSE